MNRLKRVLTTSALVLVSASVAMPALGESTRRVGGVDYSTYTAEIVVTAQQMADFTGQELSTAQSIRGMGVDPSTGELVFLTSRQKTFTEFDTPSQLVRVDVTNAASPVFETILLEPALLAQANVGDASPAINLSSNAIQVDANGIIYFSNFEGTDEVTRIDASDPENVLFQQLRQEDGVSAVFLNNDGGLSIAAFTNFGAPTDKFFSIPSTGGAETLLVESDDVTAVTFAGQAKITTGTQLANGDYIVWDEQFRGGSDQVLRIKPNGDVSIEIGVNDLDGGIPGGIEPLVAADDDTLFLWNQFPGPGGSAKLFVYPQPTDINTRTSILLADLNTALGTTGTRRAAVGATATYSPNDYTTYFYFADYNQGFIARLTFQGEPPPAEVQFTKLGEIDVSGLDGLPTDVVVLDDSAILVGGFENRRVLRVDNPSTPGSANAYTFLSTVAGDGTPIIEQGWMPGTGITSLDLSPDGGMLLVTGSATNNPAATDFTGTILVVDLNDGSLLHSLQPGLDGETVLKASAGVFYGEAFEGSFIGEIVTQFQAGTHLGVYPVDLSGFAFVGDAQIGALGRFGTDAVTVPSEDGMILFVAANTRFFAPGDIGETSDVLAIRRYNPDGNPFNFSNANPVAGDGTMGNGISRAWVEIQGDGIAANAYQGIGVLTDTVTGKVFVGVANTVAGNIEFININDRDERFQLSTGITDPVDFAHMITAGGEEFLFVTQANGQISVFGIGDNVVVPVIPGDINGDNVVNVADVTEFANLLGGGTPPSLEVGDVNDDGFVNDLDVEALANQIVN
jgi:hypothetical protein